jgi:uncharacterized protein (DUF2164 family)
MKKKPEFQFTPEQTAEIRQALRHYFLTEFDLEIGDLQADLIIDMLDQQIGKHYYNRGVIETMSAVRDNTENLILLLKE